MDNSSALQLAVEIINPNDEAKQDLKDGNLDYVDTDNGIAFAYDPEAYDTYDELADDLLPTMKLGVLNTDDSRFYPQAKLTQALADYNGLGVDDMDLSILPDLTDFSDENKDEITNAIADVERQYYSDDNAISNEIASESKAESQTQKVHDSLNYDPQSGTFSQSSTQAEQPAAQQASQPAQASIPYEKDDIKVPNDYGTQSTAVQPEAPANQNNDDSILSGLPKIENNTPNPTPSHWMKLAEELWADADKTQIIEFDPHTRKQLQGPIINVEKNIAAGRGKGIQRVYQRIQERIPEIEKAFEADFKENDNKHQDALDIIDANEKDDVARVEKNQKDKYEAGREQFIESQRPILSDRYDAENKENFTKSLNASLNSIHVNSEALRHQEESKFKQFKEKQKQKYIEHEIRAHMSFDDIMSDFNASVNDDMKALENQGESFANELNTVAQELVTKLNSAKGEAASWKNKYESLQSAYDEKVDASVSKKTNNNLTVIHRELDAKDDTIRSKEQENDTLRKSLKQAQDQNSDLNATVERLRAQAELLKGIPAANYQQQAVQQFPYPQQVQQPVAQVQQPQQPQPTQAPNNQNENNNQKSKSHKGGRIAGLIIGGLALVGLSIGGTMMFTSNAHNSNDNAPQTTQKVTASSNSVSSTSSSQPSVASDNTVKKYKAGDTWSYHNPNDNKNYTVTMDNANTGHYTDGNGQQHIVTLNNNK